MHGIEFKPPLKTIQKQFKSLADDVKKTELAHKKIAVFLDGWVQRNIVTEGGKVGGWKPFALGGRLLTDGTIDTTAKLLRDTGTLRLGFDQIATREQAGIVNSVSYAEAHEKGKGSPERRMLPEEREVAFDIIDIYNTHVSDSIKNFKLK